MISDDTYDEVQYPKKTPQNLTPASLWPHFLYSLLCSLSSCYTSLLAVLHYISSFLLENQQACCSLFLVHSSPLYNVPSQGRDKSRIIFSFELLGPVYANSLIHMAPNIYAFFCLHPLPDPNTGVRRMLALQKKMQPSLSSSCVWAEGWKKWGF